MAGVVGIDRADGSVFVEAVLAIALLFGVTSLLLETGREARTLAAMAQASYNATLLGGKTVESDRQIAMSERALDLQTAFRLDRDLTRLERSPSQSEDLKTVNFAYRGERIPLLLSALVGEVQLEFTGPILVIDSTPPDLGTFANGSCYYDCDMQPVCPAPEDLPVACPSRSVAALTAAESSSTASAADPSGAPVITAGSDGLINPAATALSEEGQEWGSGFGA